MKIVEVKKKITHDYILELYDKAKKAKGKERKELLETVELLSKNIGDYLVKKRVNPRRVQ
jgi:hypothetical protein